MKKKNNQPGKDPKTKKKKRKKERDGQRFAFQCCLMFSITGAGFGWGGGGGGVFEGARGPWRGGGFGGDSKCQSWKVYNLAARQLGWDFLKSGGGVQYGERARRGGGLGGGPAHECKTTLVF